MRWIHSSDWHLGHSLHGSGREAEHRAFLAWLLDRIEELEIEGMVLAGDLFDSANPPVSALRLWYEFLSDLDRRVKDFRLVLIGGNHDSASRLEAPRELIQTLGVHVVGGLPRLQDGELDLDRLLLEIEGREKGDSLLVAALPFLRMADLPRGEDGELDPVEGVRRIYDEVLQEAERRRRPGQPLLVTGHCYMVAGRISDLSERKILGGGEHALPSDLFPETVDYVALGHLHLAQIVDGRDRVRYSGSPIPLSLAEKDYPHQVLLLEIEGPGAVQVEELRVPRYREILRVPASGPGPLGEVLRELAALPEREEGEPEDAQPMLEVRVRLDAPEPGLRRRIEDVLEGLQPEEVTAEVTAEEEALPPKRKRKKKVEPRKKAARLVKLTIERSGKALALSEETDVAELQDLQVEEVFRKRYAQEHEGDVDARLLAAFEELQSQVLEEDAS